MYLALKMIALEEESVRGEFQTFPKAVGVCLVYSTEIEAYNELGEDTLLLNLDMVKTSQVEPAG